MKKVLLASTALIMSAGFAAADVSVGGDGRMGVLDTFGEDTELGFTSRIRIIFSASGETDAGLAFGGSIRADNAGGFNVQDGQGNTLGDDNFTATNITQVSLAGGGGVLGQSGSVFIEGAFGKLSMGDVDGAAAAAVGYVSGVGLTGLGDRNESVYIANVGGELPGALYEYSGGDWSVYASVSNPRSNFTGLAADATAWALGGSYSFGAYSVAIGYEDNDAGTDHVILGGSAAFGDFTLRANWGTASGDIDGDQWALSGDYTFGATTLTAFYNDTSSLEVAATGVSIGATNYGLGAAYDLGGGASLVGGWVDSENGETGVSSDAYDFGVSFTF
jgi:outer membrane protein OmpU